MKIETIRPVPLQPVPPTPQPQTTFGWKINQQVSRYGTSMVKSTEYLPDNGFKLLVVDTFKDGKQIIKVKELYDKSWRLLKCKVTEFLEGKKDKSYYV